MQINVLLHIHIASYPSRNITYACEYRGGGQFYSGGIRGGSIVPLHRALESFEKGRGLSPGSGFSLSRICPCK